MNYHSPYQTMLQGLLGRTYDKLDVEMLNMKIAATEDVLRYAKSNERRKLAIRLIDRQIRDRDFIIRQLNQQMLEEAQDGYVKLSLWKCFIYNRCRR